MLPARFGVFIIVFAASAMIEPCNGQRSSSEVTVISTNTRAGFVNMKEILESIPNVDATNAPDNIYHGAIVAYGKVFDFILNKGIVITDKKIFYEKNEPLWTDGTFQTKKSERAFLRWIQLQKETQFTERSYNLATNNCLTFVAKACKYLGGPEPEKLANLRKFVLQHQESAKLLNGMLLASSPDGLE